MKTKTYLKPVTAILLIGLFSVAISSNLFAAPPMSIQAGIEAAKGAGQATTLFGTDGIFTSITNTLLFIVGALSVVMIIVGGMRYVVSGGNSTSISGAKNTILYAIVGVIIAFLAYAAINFLLGALVNNGVGATSI
jgi:hypothetical protein